MITFADFLYHDDSSITKPLVVFVIHALGSEINRIKDKIGLCMHVCMLVLNGITKTYNAKTQM